jgi:diaminohydroxyphosphoribosylaminopyrimidine deaminase/5-amino-6-(5-phosphoribosylamino)uracil reductase
LAGSGRTAAGGRPHAETQALAIAAGRAAGGTAYVTLEPCAHHGQTPPCFEALLQAGIARCVIACGDPDPRTAGAGIAGLRAGGIEVATGCLAEEAGAVMAGFLCRQQTGRPFVTLKMAVSRDGFVAEQRDRRTQLSGQMAGRFVQDLRSRCDALLTGIGTVLADDPLLTCRAPFAAADSPARFVMDSQLRLPLDSQLAKTAGDVELAVICGAAASQQRANQLRAAGIAVLQAETDRPDAGYVLDQLGRQAVNHLLVEAGPALAASFSAERLADRIMVITADRLLGEGVPASNLLEKLDFPDPSAYMLESETELAPDRLSSWVKKE